MNDSITRREAIKAIGAAAAASAAGLAGINAFAANGTTETNMKVLLLNGSPREHGNTAAMLAEIAGQLKKNGVDSEIFWLGNKPVRGCIECGQCHGKCIFDDDVCNTVIDRMSECDGLIVGSPVFYGVPAGQVLSLLQRMAFAGGNVLQGKPAAAITVCRRGGATSEFQALQMPFQMLNMPIVTSQYWNIAYGGGPGEVSQDEEGMQTMRTLADNMAYMLKQLATGTAKAPEREPSKMTNFIR